MLISALFICSCNDNGSDPQVDYIEINSDIKEVTIWNEDKVYVIKKSDFYIEDTLYIEPGVIIKFPTGKDITLLNTTGGKGVVIARGTANNPIIFTSFKDDSFGGDTNGDGGATVPAEGDWGPIDLNGTTGSEFIHCEFHHGGYGLVQRGTILFSSNASAKIENCVFHKCGGGLSGNFYVGAINANSAHYNTVIRNNLFYNNTLPLSMNAEISIDDSNVFSKGSASNTFNGIFVDGDIQRNTSWEETEVAFVLSKPTTSIGFNAVLTLGDDVVLKFTDPDCSLELLGGMNSLNNFNGENVHFTSFRDDSRKGDTNGDGDSTSPAVADWTGIYIDDWGNRKNSGYADWDNIHYNNPNPTVK